MFMFCYFYDDDNDENLPNVLTLKHFCVSGLVSGDVCDAISSGRVDADLAAALLTERATQTFYSGNKQQKHFPTAVNNWLLVQ